MQHRNGIEIPESLAEVCEPARTALVVYDMQTGIVPQLPGGEEVLAQVMRVLDAARGAGVRVLFTRHMSLPVELMGAAQIRAAMTWQKQDDVTRVVSPFPRDSPQWELAAGLDPRGDEAILDKLAMSAFEGTPLQMILRDCAVSSFVIVGIATEVGIEPTCRHGADLGLRPVLVTDACGAGNPEAGARSIAALDDAGDTLLTDVEALLRSWADR